MNGWRTMVMLAALVGSAGLAGCGMQDQVLGAKGGLLLQGFDVLARPGGAVTLTARVQGGDYLAGMEGYLVGFYRLDHKLGEIRTDEDGFAEMAFTPAEAGDHVVLARLEDPDVRKYAIEAVEIVVAAREPSARMLVVDLDRTLVAGGFGQVVAGQAEPLADSERVLDRAARGRTLIYLTHRPDIFTEHTKAWLRKYDYPLGPVLTSTLSEYFKGSEGFKSAAIGELKKAFPGIEIGIGDKIADVQAYTANGMHAVLIIHPDNMKTPETVRSWIDDLAGLPAEVDVVWSWAMAEKVLLDGARCPVAEAMEMLRELERQRIEEVVRQASGTAAAPADGNDTGTAGRAPTGGGNQE